MIIFSNDAFLSSLAQRSQELNLMRTHPNHLGGQDAIGGRGMFIPGQDLGPDRAMRTGSFSDAMLQALDRVSDTQHFASALQREAIINPDAVDTHDVTIAQAQANMSLSLAQNVLNRLTQGWRDLINTR